MDQFERLVQGLTTEINGQYPRPWMTTLDDPSSAQVFIVGYNPAKPYLTSAVTHARHIDALFNRNNETCRGLYQELTNRSLTRGNIDKLTDKLFQVGVTSILETNVVCYATSKKSELSKPEHAGGRQRGRQIFGFLAKEIGPAVIVLHGKGVRDEFNKTFSDEPTLPPPPNQPRVFPQIVLNNGTRVFVMPSLALPGFQNWPRHHPFCHWADDFLTDLAEQIAKVCSR